MFLHRRFASLSLTFHGPNLPGSRYAGLLLERVGNRCIAATRPSIPIDVDDSLGKGLRGFLGQVVPDAALDDPVRVVP